MDFVNKLLSNIRFYVLIFSLSISLIIFRSVFLLDSSQIQKTILLDKYYGLISIAYLYVVLLIGPFCYTFTFFPKFFLELILKSRRAIGVSSFYFALLHSSVAFFMQLGSFQGLSYLTNSYLVSIGLGFVALTILFCLAITSFDYLVSLMHFRNWKLLHRLLYIAGFLIVVHVLTLGTDFSDLFGLIPQFSFALISFLLFLEARRVDYHIKNRKLFISNIGPATLVITALIFAYLVLAFSPIQILPSFNIHSRHILR